MSYKIKLLSKVESTEFRGSIYGQPLFVRLRKSKNPYSNSCYDYWSCREEFEYHFNKGTVSFYYYVTRSASIAEIIKVITQAEYRLKLKAKDRITFQKTSNSNLVKINLSAWWTASSLRRGILTAFIKSAAIHGASKFQESRYFRDKGTLKALEKFINGYTNLPRGQWQGGWVETFREDYWNDKQRHEHLKKD